ncbi:Ulvan-active sulfatase (Iduronate 2-sulfatase) (Polysaccharide utilization locus H protein P11) (PUL H protein P11) (Sulfatase family S1 subfamily 7 protein P11) (P11_S1_7), partial [Durusdinium trenchii]
PDILTLPEHFIANGYEAVYVGKIFHQGDTDDERSWSRRPVKWVKGIKKPRGPYALPENNRLKAENLKEMLAKYGEAARRGLASGPAFEKADVPDTAYIDGYHTRIAIATLKELAENLKEMLAKYGEAARRGLASGPAFEKADVPDTAYIDGYHTRIAIATLKELATQKEKPFFLAMGFRLPHLNWCAPAKYWDLYDPEEIPLITDGAAPIDGAAMGLHASFELRTRSNIPKYGPIDTKLARTLKHAYLASTSYVDAQIGLLLAALQE